MARQNGEKKATDFGFSSFPVCPFEIAKKEGISVHPKPSDLEGVSGGIVFAGNSPSIFYATNIDNKGYQRFTVAHELGHYFLPGHPEEIIGSGGLHSSQAGFTQGSRSIEIEADHFASGLLMPTNLVNSQLNRSEIGLDGIIALAEQAQCSLTASAIRSAECSASPMAIIVSRGSNVSYGFLSNGIKTLGIEIFPRKGANLPETVTAQFNKDPENISFAKRVCGQSSFLDWFGGKKDFELDEEVIGLGKYGYTLTVLSSESLAEDPEDFDDDEEDLEESYKPKFAYGR